VNKNSLGGTIEKNLKKIIISFQKKRVNFFFQIFPYGPPIEFLFILWYPKGSKKNWPKCHSGQRKCHQPK
jgi:hypothetical protein